MRKNKAIKRRQFIAQSTLYLAGMSLFPSCGIKRNKTSSPPNILFVFPDQMRGQALGFLKEDPVLTPNLDRFAQESVVFTQAVSNYPLCSPYRASLMTGKYPQSHGVLANCNTQGSKYGYELKTSERCWSDILKEKGYSLGYIGKWHLDAPRKPYVKCDNNSDEFAWNEWCPPSRRHGFDFWYAYGTYDQHLHPMYWTTTAKRDEPIWIDQWGPEHEADLAIKYIKNEGGRFRAPDRPFALVAAMNPPHMPYDQVPEKYQRLYEYFPLEKLCNRPNIPPVGTKWGDYYRRHIRNYLAMVTGVDEQFGRILRALAEEGLEENTIVVFTSDHGNCLGIHNQISKNNPYEESVRVPFLIRWPGKLKPRQEDLLLSSPDIYPTLLELMGWAKDIPADVEGTSFARLLLEGKGARPSSQLYLKIPYGLPSWGSRGVRTHRFTLVITRMPDRKEEIILFDRQEDPYELNNIAKKKPSLVLKLIENELIPWLEKTKDPWLENAKNIIS